MRNLKGKKVTGMYVGMAKATGIVKASYVICGKDSVHDIILDKDLSLCGGAITRPSGSIVSIDDKHTKVTI